MQYRYSITSPYEETVDHEVTCSFCNEPGGKREYMFQAKNGLSICDNCVLICAEVIGQEKEELSEEEPILN